MRRAFFVILVCLGCFLLFIRFGSELILEYLSVYPRAGIRVQSVPQANILINGVDVGKAPYQSEEYAPGDYLIEIKQDDQKRWEGYIKLNAGTLSVINRELPGKEATSSGEIITLEKGKGALVISNPEGAEVEIDGKSVGRSPVMIDALSEGEHQFILSHNNFLKRSIRAVVADGYRLQLKVDLALSEADLSKISTEPIKSSPEGVVRDTPVGYLRVRAQSSTSSKEIGRVSPGDKVTILEELPNWFRIRLSDGKEGYVASSYIDKR